MSRRFAFLLSLALVMAVALTGCGMNKEKAIEQMGQALTDSSVIESGRLTGEISGTISLGADSIPMELTMEGAFKDQMQTMAMKMSGEVMGNPLDTETYQLDGKTYTLDPTTGGYIESPSATAGMDYQQLMTLGQAEMVQLYIDGATAAEDFAFTEEENGLRVSFTMPTEQLGQMQQQISSLMTDELLPALEEQMRQSVSEQMDALLASMGGAEALQVDQAQLDALIDQQVQMVMEMERQLFESLQINGLSCDMLITDGVINDQTVGMQMEFALRDLVDSLAGSLGVTGTDTSTVPESCGLDMQIHAVIADRNQEIEIDFPDFGALARGSFLRLFYCAYSSQSCAKIQNAFSAVLRWAVAGVMSSRSPLQRRSTVTSASSRRICSITLAGMLV